MEPLIAAADVRDLRHPDRDHACVRLAHGDLLLLKL